VNEKKLELLFALQEHPTAPAAALAKQVKVSPPTTRAWLEGLRKDKVYVGVQANLRVRKLGLEIDDFLVSMDSYDALTKVEEFCRTHPYTSYRARVFGGTTHGVLLQFRQPDAARKHLVEALNIMKDKGLLTGIRELPTLTSDYGSTYTRPQLSAWNHERMTWEFDWDTWWNQAPSKVEKPKSIPESNERFELDTLDTKLLQELTRNARRKNIEIIQAMGMNPDQKGLQQLISAKIKKLNAEVIESYRVFVNWTHFDLYNTPMIIAQTKSDVTRRLIAHLSNSDFPFGSSIRETNDGFVWSARLPSAHLSELIALVWQISNSHELLIIDYKHSQNYGLWFETFDPDTSTWKSDRKFCLETPMKSIGLI